MDRLGDAPGSIAADIRRQPAEIVADLAATAREIRTPCGSGSMLWRCWGSGPALVLLHGGHGSWTHWIRSIAPLATRFTVIAPDMPGYGDSAMPPQPYSAESLAEILSQGLDQVVAPPARFQLAGFSFGGVIGGHVAALQGSRVEGFTIVGSGGMGLRRAQLEPMGSWRRLTDPEQIRATHRRNLEILMIADPAKVDALAVHLQSENAPRAHIKSRPISLTDTLKHALGRVTARVNGIWGELDATAVPWLEERELLLRALHPELRFRVIKQAGHWVAYEAAEAFNATLAELL